METFWKEQAAVIVFLRRFGWQLCRLGARKISVIKPQLDANNVNLVAIGPERLGVEEFLENQYFAGCKK